MVADCSGVEAVPLNINTLFYDLGPFCMGESSCGKLLSLFFSSVSFGCAAFGHGTRCRDAE